MKKIKKKKMKIEQKWRKVIPSGEDDSNETGKSLEGLANKNYFRKINEDNQESIILSFNFFLCENVEEDGNYSYRPLFLQIYEDEEFHYKIREDIYNYLKKVQFIF